MTEKRFAGASFPLMALVLGVAVYLTVGLVTMEVPDSVTSPGPRFFPLIITVIAYVVTLVLLIQSSRQWIYERRHASAARTKGDGEDAATDRDHVEPHDESAASDEGMNWRMIAIVVASFVAFILLLNILGWLLSAALLIFGVATGLGAKSLFTSAFVALTMSAIVQLAFVGGLGLPLPAGFLGGF